MAQVTLPYSLTAGTPENVNNLVANLNALRDGVNTIDTAQIANGAVTAAKLAAGAATPANGSITPAMLDNDILSLTAITGGGVTRRVSISATGEHNQGTTVSYTDVPGASGTVNVATGSFTQIVASWETKVSTDPGTLAFPRVKIIVGNAEYPQPVENSTGYVNRAYSVGVPVAASGSGTQTVKMQAISGLWSCCGNNTFYELSVRNVTIYILNYKI